MLRDYSAKCVILSEALFSPSKPRSTKWATKAGLGYVGPLWPISTYSRRFFPLCHSQAEHFGRVAAQVFNFTVGGFGLDVVELAVDGFG